jgi:hypothetical protein
MIGTVVAALARIRDRTNQANEVRKQRFERAAENNKLRQRGTERDSMGRESSRQSLPDRLEIPPGIGSDL